MTHPVVGLDDVVHQRTRLGILVLLQQAAQVDFGTLREQLAVTDGNLSQHLKVLEESRYVEVRKGYEGRRPRTWLKITRQGRTALSRELQLLRQIVGTEDAGRAVPAPRAPRGTKAETKAVATLTPKLA
jgi:DNA-binding MarR family transcriptional regulator